MEQITPPFFARVKLGIVSAILWTQNLVLELFRLALFQKIKNPKNIVIFKIGNIGDITCAIPTFIALRKKYSSGKITLLTSPGKYGTLGAKDFLSGARYFDDMYSYYSEDISTIEGKRKLLNNLKEKHFDFFIQIPDDWVSFKTLFRNIIFAKLIGVRGAFGFQVRSFLFLFRKTQIDYTLKQNEVVSLLKLFIKKTDTIEFDFPIHHEVEKKIETILSTDNHDKRYIGICMGGKDEAKRWPIERFGEIVKYLIKQHRVQIIIFGGGSADQKDALSIKEMCGNSNVVLDMTSNFSIHEQIVTLKKCSFLLTNDTGPMHLAVAVKTPVVALFSIRNVLGAWFPYGEGHRILFHRFLSCNYYDETCIKESISHISLEEVKKACDEILEEKYNKEL